MPYAFEGGISTDNSPSSIEITEAQYEAALEALCGGKVVSITNGFEIIDPPVAPPEVPEEPDRTLDEWKGLLTMKIDSDAEAARLRYITAGSGQAMTYQQKAQEAAAVLADPSPTLENYPLLAAEVGITAATIQEVAQVVDGAFQAWRVVGGRIEGLRLGGKAAVAAATTVEDAKAAAAIDWV